MTCNRASRSAFPSPTLEFIEGAQVLFCSARARDPHCTQRIQLTQSPSQIGPELRIGPLINLLEGLSACCETQKRARRSTCRMNDIACRLSVTCEFTCRTA